MLKKPKRDNLASEWIGLILLGLDCDWDWVQLPFATMDYHGLMYSSRHHAIISFCALSCVLRPPAWLYP